MRLPDTCGREEWGAVFPDNLDFMIIGGVVILQFLVRYIASYFIFWPIGRRCAIEHKGKLTNEDIITLHKYVKYCWHLVNYGILWVIAVYYLLTNWWAFSGPNMVDFPMHPDEMRPFKVYLMYQLCWYIHNVFETLIFDSTRNDLYLMLVHHLCAVFLIFYSSHTNNHRVAITVVGTLDIGDVIMYIAKLLHSSVAIEFTKTKFTRVIAIITLSTTFNISRIGILGWILYYLLIYTGSPMDVCSTVPETAFLYQCMRWGVFALWIMQLIWGIGLIRMAFDIISHEMGDFVDFFSDAISIPVAKKEKKK